AIAINRSPLTLQWSSRCSRTGRGRSMRTKLHALRGICDVFPLGPSCGVDAPAQIGQLRFLNIQMRKRTNGVLISRNCCATPGIAFDGLSNSKRRNDPAVTVAATALQKRDGDFGASLLRDAPRFALRPPQQTR